MKFNTQFLLVINQHTYNLEVTRIEMIRHLLILSMVCVLGHTLICRPCNDPMHPIRCPLPPKCCTSGELTPDICGCCLTCAKGKIIYSQYYKHQLNAMASTIDCCFCLLISTLKVKAKLTAFYCHV